MKADMGPWATPAEGTAKRESADLSQGRAPKGSRHATDMIRWVRAAGTACAVLLLSGLSAWGQGVAGDPGCRPWAQKAGTPAALESVAEDTSASPEGAKKAIGWAVGLKSGGYGTVLHTTDGGQTWVRQGTPEEMGESDLFGAAAASAQEAWVAGNVGLDGILLHTRDGGQTWNAEGDPNDLAGNGLIAVSAVNSTTAWAVGENGIILYTADGGKHWTSQTIPANPQMWGISFVK
jgi:hypothetical protein